jgi:hypothetical protein
MGRNNESQTIVRPLAKRLSDSEDLSTTASSFLFPHLVNKRKSMDPEEEEVTFRISDMVSPKKTFKLCEAASSEKPSATDYHKEHVTISPEVSGEADLFADDDEEIQTKDEEVFPDLRRPLRRLFEDEDTEEASPLVSKNPRLKIRQNANVESTQISRGDKTPVKSSGDARVHKTPVKLIDLSSSKSAPVDTTPVKSNIPQHNTPVKTPAQKRGDQNYEERENTPVKPVPSRTTRSGNRTPVKSLPLDNSANSTQTVPTSMKRRSQTVSNVETIGNNPTPVEESKSTNSVIISIKKDPTQISTVNKALVTPNKDKEVNVVKPTPESTSIPTTAATTGPPERPSRRKSVSIRFGIDDVPLTDAVWSPAGKSARSSWRSETPSKTGGMTPTAASRTCTPKNSRLLSPSANNSDLNTPNKLAGGTKSKQRKTPKTSLFSTDETDSDSQPVSMDNESLNFGKEHHVAETAQTLSDKFSSKKRKRCNKLEATEDTEDPWQTVDAQISDPQHVTLPKRTTRASDSGQLFLPRRGSITTDSLPTRSSGRLTHHKTFSSSDGSKFKSEMSSFDMTDNEVFELDSPAGVQNPNMTIIPLKLKLKTSDCDLNDSLGQQITEMCSKNRSDNISNTFVTPSLKNRKNTGSPKSRTPKRLRSGSKKSSPNSKRLRLHIEFASSPPIITDTSNCSDSRRKRKLTETHTTRAIEEEDYSVRFVSLLRYFLFSYTVFNQIYQIIII